MVAVPMKPEYGPTLGRLLAPRWHAASQLTRSMLTATGVALLVLIVAAVLTLENATFSHGGKVPFSFSYRGLYRASPDPGGYVKVRRLHSDGTIADSFAVDPLRLAPYSGSLEGVLPIYAAGYIATLTRRYPSFVLRGEGKTKVNNVPAYDVFYTAVVDAHKVYGRDVLLLPERAGAREGVDIVMLTSSLRSSRLSSPMEVATTGILLRPLKSFTFG
jgi:hypothetical protein